MKKLLCVLFISLASFQVFADETSVDTVTYRSPHNFAFGLSGTIGGGPSFGSGGIGANFMFADHFNFIANLNFGINAAGGPAIVTFGLTPEFNYLFLDATRSFRPFIGGLIGVAYSTVTTATGFGVPIAVGTVTLPIAFQAGGYYFFSPHFAMSLKILVGTNISVPTLGGPASVAFGLWTPAIGAHIFF